MKKKCEICITLDLPVEVGKKVVQAIRIEAENEKTRNKESDDALPRTDVSIDLCGNLLTLRVIANDLSALRAGINSYIRWLNLAMETVNLSSSK
jgi:tRNA threonylcarbamoyladenosine modification (KEOPS) complex  Pcc1 subunit